MKRGLFFAYGIFSYLLFLATYALFAAFVGNLWLPRTIDSPADGGWTAWVVNLALVALFAAQHSVMARPWFKEIWTRIVPQPIERSTYMIASCLALFVLMWQWRAIGPVLWDVQQPVGRGLLWALFVAGWLLVPAVSLLISHFDLFGMRQVWLYLQGRPYESLPFRTPLAYDHVRHPLYIAWTIAFWATPTMTLGHAIFAASLTLYMVLAALVEERDLVAHFGDTYRAYQRRVPMFIPRIGASERASADERQASHYNHPERIE